METTDSSRAAILEKFLELGRSRDMAALEAMITEDIRIQQAPSLPFGGVYVGWAGYLDVTEQLFGRMRKVGPLEVQCCCFLQFRLSPKAIVPSFFSDFLVVGEAALAADLVTA